MIGLKLAFAFGSLVVFASTACASVPSDTSSNIQQEEVLELSISELREQYSDADSRYVTIHDIELHYKDEGSGPVLLMIHGSQSTLRTYDRITELLKDEYRIIRLDMPGFGLSGAVPAETARTVKPVEMVEGFIDHLELKRITAVGVSSGGTMSAFLAAKRPDQVERLVLSNMPSDAYRTDHLVMPESFLAAQKRLAETGRYDRGFWVEYLRYFAGNPERMTEEIIDEYNDFGKRPADPHLLALIARVGDGKAAQAEFAKVTAPTLLIWGTSDPLLPESASAALVGYLPNASVSRVLLNDVGHYPPLEAPDRFAHIMKAYLQNAFEAR